jgi:hypothetical protein
VKLTSLLVPQPPHGQLTPALLDWAATSDNGTIVTHAFGPYGGIYFLLTPVPEPSALALAGVALAAWATRVHARRTRAV